MPEVIKIPATITKYSRQPLNSKQKRKVAAYVRVSTDSEEQEGSFEFQYNYFTRYINSRDDYELVDVYADEGITGLNTKKRKGFKEMMTAAKAGEIDLIIVKSLSRFTRNVEDFCKYTDLLKEYGCEVYFQEEAMSSFDEKAVMIMQIFASIAQEQSRTTSANVTWGLRKRYEEGKVSLAYSSFLGYDKGEDGNMIINEEQAKIVRLIYSLFMHGYSFASICRELENRKIKSPMGKDKWRPTTVKSILSNEKYRGDALLQKTFVFDFLNKKTKINEGEIPQFYVTGNHDYIIDPREFDIVQEELARRKGLGQSFSGKNIFSSKLVCGDCGALFGCKVWHSNSPYRKEIWRCNRKFDGDKKCNTPHVEAETVKEKFLQAYNKFMADREELLDNMELMKTTVCDVTELNEKILELQITLDGIQKHILSLFDTDKVSPTEQLELISQHSRLESRIEELTAELNAAEEEKKSRLEKASRISIVIESVRTAPLVLNSWDENLWVALIEKVTVMSDGCLEFQFKNEKKITI